MKAFGRSNRLARKASHKLFGKSRSKSNAAGYEKRRARKAKANVSSVDIYEHIPEKNKRSNIRLDFDREEEWEFGADIDDATDVQREAFRAKLIGENVDGEEIIGDDDEEIDSDDSFEESDEEKFADVFSKKHLSIKRKKGKAVVRFADVDLNEDENMDSFPQEHQRSEEDEDEDEEEETGDDDDFIDLVDVLDGKGELDTGSNDGRVSSKKNDLPSSKDADGDEDLGSEDEDSSEVEEEPEGDTFVPSDDEVAPDALDHLQNFVSNLDVTSKKRKATDEEDGPTVSSANQRRNKRRLLPEKTEAGDENEFRVQSSGTKLKIDDLLAPLGQSSALQSLKKTTKVLAASGSSKAKPLSAPLPHRTQERLNRQAAYEQTKEEVDKWSETMKRIREAEHLSFPLQALSSSGPSNMELNAKFKPTTELERSVDNILKAAKMREEDILETEDAKLKMNKLSVEEIAQRRSELRRMRELMFRSEIKGRRVNKIKSKTYRRLKRKEKERLGEVIDEKAAADDSETEEGRLKREIERAKERATLRHKHTGKWAKQMRSRDDADEETRKDLEDMLARGDKLRRRIQGAASDESEEENDEDDDDDAGLNVEEGIVKIKRDAFDELAKLGNEVTAGDGQKTGKSVFEMKFMKDAMARQAAATNKEVDDFIKEMEGDVAKELVNGPEQVSLGGVVAVRTGGRVVYRPGTALKTLQKTDSLAPPMSDTSSVTLKSTDLLSPPPPSPPLVKRSGLAAPLVTQESNPWLVRDKETTAKAPKKKNNVVVSKDSKALDKAKHRLGKQAEKNVVERERALGDAVVEISMGNVLQLPSSTAPKTIPTDEVEDSGDNSEIEAQEQALLKDRGKAKTKAFKQRDLVALAFAGDNVVQNFEEAKRREIAADAPKELDTTLPGWGSWGGAGMKKAPPKRERIKIIPGIDPTSRADHGKKNVIISERKDKKALKYLVKDLPYPYTSKAQFERSMETPLGPEWNTRLGFQRGTLPRVVKKPGVIIEPLEKLS